MMMLNGHIYGVLKSQTVICRAFLTERKVVMETEQSEL